MHLWVPEPGSTFRLTDDWSFSIKNDGKNRALIGYLRISVSEEHDGKTYLATLPKDSEISIVKYDIKPGRAQNNHIVLRLERCPKNPRRNSKIAVFWLPLSQTSTAQIEVLKDVTRNYLQPVGKKPVRGEPMSFGELNQLTKDTKNGFDQYEYFMSFVDPYTNKRHDLKSPLYRDRSYPTPSLVTAQSRFTAHHKSGGAYAYVRFYLDEKIVSATMPLENIPARVIVPKSQHVFYAHSYERDIDFKKTQITIYCTEWADSGQADRSSV